MQEQQNLMHISSSNIGTMDSPTEYQQLFINNLIGSSSNKDLLRAKRDKTLNIKVDNLEDIWILLEDRYNLYTTGEYSCILIEENFIAKISWITFS